MDRMPAGAMVSVEQYLSTTYRPDCDYVDGEVVERHLGEQGHSWTQREIIFFLGRHPHLRRLIYPEQRVQVSATRFRIPDICVLREDAEIGPIVRTPPLLCIEILSRADSLSDIAQRVDEYLEMGVEVCWVIDPLARKAWIATRVGELIRAQDDTLRAASVEMPLIQVLPEIQ